MKTTAFIALFATLFLFTACNKDEEHSIKLNETFELDYRKSKTFDQGNFNITFENLIEDSRCPANVICIWEGRAVVEIKIQSGVDVDLYTLTTINSVDGDTLSSIQHDNYSIKLIEVNPYPQTASSTPDAKDYSVKLQITEAE